MGVGGKRRFNLARKRHPRRTSALTDARLYFVTRQTRLHKSGTLANLTEPCVHCFAHLLKPDHPRDLCTFLRRMEPLSQRPCSPRQAIATATNKDVQPHNARRRSRQDDLHAFATKELRRAITTSELMPLRAADSVYQESSKRASHGVGLTCLIGCVSTTQRADKLSAVWLPCNPRPKTSVCMTIAKCRRSLRRNNAG